MLLFVILLVFLKWLILVEAVVASLVWLCLVVVECFYGYIVADEECLDIGF